MPRCDAYAGIGGVETTAGGGQHLPWVHEGVTLRAKPEESALKEEKLGEGEETEDDVDEYARGGTVRVLGIVGNGLWIVRRFVDVHYGQRPTSDGAPKQQNLRHKCHESREAQASIRWYVLGFKKCDDAVFTC